MEEVDLKALIKEIKRVGLRQWLLTALTEAFENARKGKLKSGDEHSFELNWMENLVKLRDAILERRYELGRSVAFVVFDPMVREIFAAPFKDRVVHHFLYTMQTGWWDKRFIFDSYSCRVGKGTLMGIKRAQRMMRQVTNNFTEEAWVVKLDIQGYFMSLPRRRLYEKVRWGLRRQFASVMNDPIGQQLFSICDYLWEKVLMDDPVERAWRRGPSWHWNPEVLPEKKSLYRQPKGYGLPIGNVTSQVASNIYLDAFDRYVKFVLGYWFYGRYVDDFFLMVQRKDKERLLKDVKKMEVFLKDELELTLHPKKRYCQEVRKGFNFLGARIYPHCLYPSDRLQSRMPAALRQLVAGEGSWEAVVSYFGLLRHLDANKCIEDVLRQTGQIV